MTSNQQENRRSDVIRCEFCGEDYSVTYRRCPFCDERPGRRIDDRGTRGPLQVAVLVVTLIIILAAAFIVFSKVAPLLTGREPEVEQPSVEQPSDPSTEPGTQIPEDTTPVDTVTEGTQGGTETPETPSAGDAQESAPVPAGA